MAEKNVSFFLGQIIGLMRDSFSPLWRLEGSLRGVQFQGRVVFRGRPLVSLAKNSRIIIGDGVQVNSALRANPLGCFQPSVLRTLASSAQLILGRDVGISGTVLVAGKHIEIGEGTIIGSGAMVIDNDFHTPRGEWGWNTDFESTARPIRIGRGVFIGARAIVLKGVTIGDRAVVGAGAVVTRDVPAGALAAGNPAKVVSRGSSGPVGAK